MPNMIVPPNKTQTGLLILNTTMQDLQRYTNGFGSGTGSHTIQILTVHLNTPVLNKEISKMCNSYIVEAQLALEVCAN